MNGELRPVLTQSEIERQMIQGTKNGLLAALDWQTRGETFTRKLSTLRFAVRSFAEQLERTFALEEHDGYMDFVNEVCPQFDKLVVQLQADHGRLREKLDEQLIRLDRLMPDDHAKLAELTENLRSIVKEFDRHTSREIALIQEAFNSDIGTGD